MRNTSRSYVAAIAAAEFCRPDRCRRLSPDMSSGIGENGRVGIEPHIAAEIDIDDSAGTVRGIIDDLRKRAAATAAASITAVAADAACRRHTSVAGTSVADAIDLI